MMHSRTTRLLLLVPLLLGGLAVVTRAQMVDPEAEKARQLVERVRRGLREVDSLLLSGASSRVTSEQIEENVRRIEELLREAESRSRSVVQSIDELIKIARYQQQNQSQQGGQGDPDQPQPPDQQGQGKEREKSQDPGQLQPQQNSSGEDQQPPSTGDPRSPRPDDSPPDQQQTSTPPPQGASGEFERVDTTGRWGLLPPKEAEDLQRHNVEDIPQRYRPYYELYFRRVNQGERRP